MKYEIHIGEAIDAKTLKTIPKYRMIITEEQKAVIDWFANIEMDSELNKSYKLNACEFTIHPHTTRINWEDLANKLV